MTYFVQHSVAVVDDDPRVRESLDSLLESSGFLVRLFASAEDFLKADLMAKVDCVISDVRMPGMDGLELQRKVRAVSPKLPIILLTAHHHDDVRQRALNTGAFCFLQKPFDADELVHVVQSAVELPPSSR